jgi:UDP-GlcNAc:undecaprenyl-phosphate GlcNAc-1-phosphate transferase
MTLIFISVLINFFIILKYKEISNFLNIYDYPDKERKIHLKKVPLIGGLIVYINFLLFFIFVIFVPDFFEENLKSLFQSKLSFFYLFLISSSILILGVYDDKKNLNANLKFIILVILTFFLIKLNGNLVIESIYFESLNYTFFTYEYSILLTILCFLLFINASNMYDGINLQLAPYFIFIFLLFLIKLNLFQFSVIFLIPLLAFCYLNYNGQIFIGNAGAYFISFLIAYIFVKQNNLAMIIKPEEIFLIMSIPGLDLLRLFIYRILKKRNPFSADKNHLHHYIIKNFEIRKSQIFIFFLNIGPFCVYQLYESFNVILLTIFIYILIYFLLSKKKTNNVN